MQEPYWSGPMSGWGAPHPIARGLGVKDSPTFLTPTWQIGQAQNNDRVANFIEHGYAENSLIYACVQRIATDFSALPPQHLRKTSVGTEVVPSSPIIDLLNNPSETMDGIEFREALMVHHRVGGNVYIQKVRGRGRAVIGLELLRPDYVRIIPGARRADDVFEVRIGGRVVAQLPRADVIHIKTPNPSNDFYGLSPIALLVREGTIDLHMSDFELAFYRNAGVPFGLLKTKTRLSPQGVTDAASAFRRAFNGLRNWFNLIVIAADEAEYQQLGIAQSDMEMSSTRLQAESRITAVYGIPPVLVGARVGLENSPWSNTEFAWRFYWANTMTALSRAIASALNRELVPEFATSAGQSIAFDLSGVEALQDDNVAKLGAVAQLYGTGGWTQNEAMRLVGFDPMPGGDFYVRNISQSIERQVQTQTRALRVATRSIQQVQAETVHRLTERAMPEIKAGFAEQARRIMDRMESRKDALPDDLFVMSEEDAFWRDLLAPFHELAVGAGFQLALNLTGGGTYQQTSPAVQAAIAKAGERVTRINDTTRAELQAHLATGYERGYSLSMMARGVPDEGFPGIKDLPAFSEARAMMVARTEMAGANNLGSVSRYRDSGIVESVRVFDGPDCGWTDHNDPDAADGSVRSLSDAEDFPYAHPNCLRSFSPVMADA